MLIQNKSSLPKISDVPKIIALDTETFPDSSIEGFSFAYREGNKIRHYYIPVAHEFLEEDEWCNIDNALDYLREIVKGRRIIFHNAEFDLTVLEKIGIEIDIADVEDTMVLHFTLDTERKHGLKDIMALEYGQKVVTYEEAKDSDFSTFAKYGSNDARYTLFLWYDLMKQIKKFPKTYKLYRNVEMPFVRILQGMNVYNNGIRIDAPLIIRYKKMMEEEIEFIEATVREKLGNISITSPKQLADALVNIGVNVPRKEPTKKMIEKAEAKGEIPEGNYSTSSRVLEKLFVKYSSKVELDAIMYSRKIQKLHSTYTGPIHRDMKKKADNVYILEGYDFSQLVARTGRLTCYTPNMQNQPRDPLVLRLPFMQELKKFGLIKKNVRYLTLKQMKEFLIVFEDDAEHNFSDKDVEIIKKAVEKSSVDMRAIYIPMPGKVFIGADYSQLELRMCAHLSKDKYMSETFEKDGDIHRDTSERITEKYAKMSRQQAKTFNFKIQYGGYYTTLAIDLGISLEEAKKMYNGYMQTYAGRTKWIKELHSSARRSHFAQTILGRRRNVYTLGINSDNFSKRNHAENAVISHAVSGSSSDLIKVAMVNIWLKNKKHCPIKLQIHDELLLEVSEKNADKWLKITTDCMENAFKLSIPIKVDAKVGKSWRGVH